MAAALEVLDARPRGIDMYLQADFDRDDYRGYVCVRLDREFLEMVHRCQAFCNAEPVSEIRLSVKPASWVAQPDKTINVWCLSIYGELLAYGGRERVTDTAAFDSVLISLAQITETLAKSSTSPVAADIVIDETFGSFAWVGNCMVYSKDASVGFVESILHRCPEVAAAQREIDMAERITATASEGLTSPHSQRRRTPV